ncbi:MAG TPA: putative Ig domain-containing protein [Steroidobacteraceae bacterium]|nr:putative Ig domain-containing protein [Steroidobacteraceae bacterium]
MTPNHGLIVRNLLVACALATLATGCFEEERPDESGDDSGGTPSTNQAPTISGSPPASLVVGQSYDFTPTASDPDGDALTFSIQNRPSWATFSTVNGRLSGTPGAGDVGTFSNVQITVSDGSAQASLGVFSIAVNQIANGSVTLSWIPPTTNEDGTTLTDLAGYRIYYGRSANALDQTITIGNAGTTRWVVENLSTATWYFAMTSYRTNGIESERTGTVASNVT